LSHCPVEHHAFHLCRSLFGGSATLTRKLSSTTLNVEPHHLSIWRPRLPRRSIQRWPSFSHRQTCINRLEKSHSPPIRAMDIWSNTADQKSETSRREDMDKTFRVCVLWLGFAVGLGIT
jgi:hypothetical protein